MPRLTERERKENSGCGNRKGKQLTRHKFFSRKNEWLVTIIIEDGIWKLKFRRTG